MSRAIYSAIYSGSELILQTFHHFTYFTTHSQTLPSLYLRHSSFSNPSVGSLTSELILRPFRRLTYATAHSPTLPLLHLRHSSFSNPCFASPTSQALHLIHLASSPCSRCKINSQCETLLYFLVCNAQRQILILERLISGSINSVF